MLQNKIGILCVLVTLLTLMGCGHSQQKQMQAYINSVKERSVAHVDPIPHLKPYAAYTYPDLQARDPFVALVDRHMQGAPIRQRQKEPLEAFPLDALRMVGLVKHDGRVWAVISAPDGAVYQVTLGRYMGQNNGRVEKVSDKEITVLETVPSEAGWEKRPAKLSLVGE